MKSRPRSVERKVAEYLTTMLFSDIGKAPVQRIPVLGRTGPDITMNSLSWVIDVKSRLQVPKGVFCKEGLLDDGVFLSIRLSVIVDLTNTTFECGRAPSFGKTVTDWWNHMDEWTREFCPDGLTMLILHKPRMPIGKSVVIIHKKDLRRFLTWREDAQQK